jgi:hypothetical protein
MDIDNNAVVMLVGFIIGEIVGIRAVRNARMVTGLLPSATASLR